ncbi:hypothetical protein EVAR_24649_1 [Eumeta japonica]|uniref:Secreted protein n=1 Tax=Eumeta variegata TaxID=151549 RepID=A0A4C1V2P1_EUMVA|nr:hypothetical protein EVAR_24649_1 [Eumeta japonica]
MDSISISNALGYKNFICLFVFVGSVCNAAGATLNHNGLHRRAWCDKYKARHYLQNSKTTDQPESFPNILNNAVRCSNLVPASPPGP